MLEPTNSTLNDTLVRCSMGGALGTLFAGTFVFAWSLGCAAARVLCSLFHLSERVVAFGALYPSLFSGSVIAMYSTGVGSLFCGIGCLATSGSSIKFKDKKGQPLDHLRYGIASLVFGVIFIFVATVALRSP